ncbi:unnamed protein product [Clavelina lepadiformis]|uniref:Nuclear pore complex protein Nup160 n=1 Tax=Clavelina lepadiformis TaxID=159417 RepID=A0ABP0EY20_CLALP
MPNKIIPQLLRLEVPVYLNEISSELRRCQEIIINEGQADPKFAESCSYPDFGGGEEITKDGDETSTIFWKTRGNTLELFEYSLNADLLHNHFSIVFQNSKVLPGVVVSCTNNHLFILFATIHGAHRIVLSGGQNRNKGLSVLSGLTESTFSASSNNFYFTQLEQVTCFTAGILKCARQSGGAVFIFGQNSASIAVVKMPLKGQSSLVKLNQSSRISRIWSGINPWASSGADETPFGLAMVNSKNPSAIVACNDCKLRVMSCQTQEYVAQFNLAEYFQDDFQEKEQAQNHKIRSVKNADNDNLLISIYLSIGEDSVFLNFDFNSENNSLHHISTIYCCSETELALRLIDYQVSPSGKLWALWTDTADETSLAVCDINKMIWHDVALSQAPPQEVIVPEEQSVQEYFVKQLFVSGNFSHISIAKALSIQQRSVVSHRNTTWKLLRDNTIKAINNEVEALLPEDESASETQRAEVELGAWQSFYQSCVQYQQHVCKPLGLTTSSSGNICVVKKEHISYLVPVSSLEAVCRGANPTVCSSSLPEDENLEDLGKLVNCLSLLANILGQEFIDYLLQTLAYHKSPVNAVKESLDSIKEALSERSDHFALEENLANIGDMMSSVRMLLACLEPGVINNEIVGEESADINGDCGIEILCRVIQRYVNDRLQLSMLLLVTSILFDELQDTVPTRVAIYVQAYRAIKWIITTEPETISQNSLESTLHMLSMHDEPTTDVLPSLLIDYYLRNKGGKLMMELLNKPGALNIEMMPTAAATIVQLLWPLGPTMSLLEFLLSKVQFSRLKHYIEQELNTWCDYCPAYTSYLLAHCHLHNGNFDQAVKTFLHGGGKINSEEVHLSRLLQTDEDHDTDLIEIQYYIKILQIFEGLDMHEQVITVATHAISKVNQDDSRLAIFASSVFRHSLALHRHVDAYKAILWNPDPELRKDCLRALVVTLCERKEYKTLVEYPYDDLHEDLVNILEHRARCSDLFNTTHKYYDLLYAFHVYRRNYRRAASTMYEQAWRIGTEQGRYNALNRKHVCLISAVTCLHLVDSDNRWIVHPAITQEPAPMRGSESPKRNHDGTGVELSSGKRKLVVCEIADIQKEILLVEARLKISAETKDEAASGASMSASETITWLTHAGLYEDAFTIGTEFNISLTSIFQSLATRCVRSSYCANDSQVSSWLSKQDRTTLDDGHSSESDVAWRYLKEFLGKYGKSSGCYRTVLTTLLSYSCTLPAWFVNDYKRLNCPELIRQLICYDYLEKATSLCLEYVDAVMGIGSEYLNITSTLLTTGKQVWLPYNEIEQLLYVLNGMRSQEKYNQLHQLVSAKMEDYFEVAERATTAMVQTYVY